ncbi:uncharacterized protein [Rutidosis leptorrhynchoides]|uniref:uncharacterized protein n=1 Tax=Rutidosis leptorrhynchoides TaxID=125765 RepID=UPI003A9A2417
MNTSFWCDTWLTVGPLKDIYCRLFRLEINKQATVGDRFECDGSKYTVSGQWSRAPSGRTLGEYNELCRLLSAVSINSDKRDYWEWSISRNGRFATSVLTCKINECILEDGPNAMETLRNNLVPKKVEVFVWRAKKRRLSVLAELDKRGTDLHSVRCPICDADIETVDHSLFLCKQAFDIWGKVREWWGLGGIGNTNIGDAFCGYSSRSKSDLGAKIWQGVEWTCGYLIWKNRNQKVFKNKVWNVPVALNEIQVKSYEWIARRCKSKTIDWHNWLHNPQVFENI